MSRLAKKPYLIPAGVTFTNEDGKWVVKGPKGSVGVVVNPLVKIDLNDQAMQVSVPHPQKVEERALLGLTVRLVANACEGVTKGYSRTLEIQGIGYKVALTGNKLVFEIGFSHSVPVELPQGIEASIEKNLLTLKGCDKQVVGEIASRLRGLRPPEPYKGKGIRYQGEVVKKKAGKAAKAAGAKA